MKALWLCLVLITIAAQVHAQPPPDPSAKPHEQEPRTLDIAAIPVLGDASITLGGWTELLVRITNRGSESANGTVTVFGSLSRYSSDKTTEVRAPYAVSGGATVSLRVPFRVGWDGDPVVRVLAADGKKLYEQAFTRTSDNRTLLVDVSRTPALAAVLRGIAVAARVEPWSVGHMGYPSAGSASVAEVSSPMYDPVTGDALLPRHAAGYARVAAVLMRSDELVRLAAEELEALSGFVMSGGTFAIVLSRPEDMRHAVVTAFVGGEVERTGPGIELLREIVLPLASGGTGYYPGGKFAPRQSSPEPAISEALTGYKGGNLHPSPYGASATYGLGEVHLLGFNAQERPAIDSSWVHVRMIDMLRRANERTLTSLYRHGGPHTPATEVRRQLDPNEGARWAIIVTALLLCAYSVVAGPINFTYWRKKHRPLRAFLYVPLAAALTFGSVVTIGVIAKGCSGRARHLTVVEAGAGMTRGSARRWRGFFVPSQRTMTVQTAGATSILGSELMNNGDETRDAMLLDRDGLKLVDLPLLPWETMVVREDGYVDLGEGIAIVKKSATETLVVNRTGRRLRGLLLHEPPGTGLFLSELEEGATASSTNFDRLTFTTHGTTPGGLPLGEFDAHAVAQKLNQTSSGLGDAWTAVLTTITQQKDWFPADVPVLLAQLEGGEGKTSDTGLTLDSDRVLVRIVGYGGAP